MKKKQIILLLTISVMINMIHAQVVVGKQYTEQELKSLDNLTLIYQIPITNRIIEIYGIPTKVQNKFESSKLFVLKNLNFDYLDGLGTIYYTDNTHIGPDYRNLRSILFSVKFKEKPIYNFIYADENSMRFKLFIRENWVASAIIVDNFILYSTEFSNDTIIRIDTTNGERFSYTGYFPNVDLYPTDDNYMAFFEYENRTYVLTESEIIQTEKKYEKKQQFTLNDYYVLQ